jgi:hypothetical protein
MKKEFELSAKINTADFDRSVQEMVKKLKDLTAPVTASAGAAAQRMQAQGMGGLSPQSMEAYQRATSTARRELDQLITEHARGQEKLGKFIVQRTESIKQLVKEQKTLVKDSEAELAIRKQITEAEKNQQQLKEAYRQRDSQLNQALDHREQMNAQAKEAIMARNPSGWGRAGRFASQGMYGAMGREAVSAMGGIGGIARGIGGIGSGLVSAGVAGEKFAGYGQRLEHARGSAIESTAGQNLRDVYGGRAPFESAFTEERDAAAGLASQKAGRNRITDRLMGIGSAGMILGGGAMALTGAGLVPGLALMAGGVAGLTNDRNRQGIFGGKEYEQLLASQQGEDFRRNYENLKNQDPGKRLALENFEQFKDRNVGSQRQLGLSNDQFYRGGGFLSDVQQKGFMGEQGIGMANQIIGAGGSARMGRQAGFGLQMERAGMTNASAILGSTSASIQNPEANKRATIAIMSEAFKIGLDNTEFAEENRRFAQAAAGIIGRTGTTSEADQDRLSGILGRFLGEKTNTGVASAQSAYERAQERGSQTSGRRGSLRFGAAMKDKDLSKLQEGDLEELLSMRPEEMNSSNPAMAEFARIAGISVDELIEKVQGRGGVNEQGRFIFPGQKKKISDASATVDDFMKKNKLSFSDLGDKARKGELPENVQQALGRIMIEQNKSEAGGLTTSEGIAAAGEFVTGQGRPGVTKEGTKDLLDKGPGRLEDEFTKKASEGAEAARKNFNSMTEQLWKAVDGAKAFTDAVAPLANVLSTGSQNNRMSLPQGKGTNTDITGNFTGNASVQPTANKPKGP